MDVEHKAIRVLPRNARRFVIVFLTIVSIMLLASCGNPKEYTITFNTGTDITIYPIVETEGQAIFEPNPPDRDGYRFDGWYLDGELFHFTVMPAMDIELTAHWSEFFTITFDTDGGNTIPSVSVVEGDSITLPKEPERDHYKFTGWNYGGESFDDVTMPSSDITLVATWTPASTIYFNVSVYDRHLDETVDIQIESIVEVAGQPVSPPDDPRYAEYKFLSWQLDGQDYMFTTMPSEDITLTASWLKLSNLPAMFIDLYNQDNSEVPLENVNREYYVSSKISLENTTDEFTIENSDALFKGRGNGSWVDAGDKRGYRIKFDDDQSILGSPSSRHWVLLANANFDDVTMFRNRLAYGMSNEVFTNIEYATSTNFVDLYVNGEYRGVYLVAEHLRVDEDRVDIDSEFGVLDTGYLIEYDNYASGTEGVDYFRVNGLPYPFSMHSPKPDDYIEEGITLEQYKAQVSYIQALVSTMVTAVMDKDFETFSAFADVDSFVDMYILHELFKNIDTGYSSFYIYRNPGGKLIAGPPWDFDATLGCSPTRGNGSPAGIYVGLAVQAFSARTANQLLITLYATPEFKDAVVSRWNVISPDIQSYVDRTLSDEMIETYRYAMGRNFVRWPTPMGFGTPVDQETAEENWENNIIIARQWLTDRIEWLNGEWSPPQ